LLGACAGQPAPEAVVEGETVVFTALGSDGIMARIGELPPQELGAKECGLFLWLKREDTPLVFFQRATGEALMALDQPEQSLEQEGAEAPIAFQYFREQRFTADGVSIALSIEPEELRTLQRGRKIPNGKIALRTEDGWGATLPVAGVIACK
jgi:hypothetical protein